MPTTKTVLIDGDIVAYRCGFAAEHTSYHLDVGDMIYKFDGKRLMNVWLKEYEPEEYSWSTELRVEPLNFVLGTVKRMIANIVKGCDAEEYRIFLSDRGNFRHDLATIKKYKGNRDKKRPPLHIKDIREYLNVVHHAETLPNLEADDALAMYQTEDTAIASIDKDLLQIPGKHFNFVNGTKLLVSEETALRNKMKQILTGDATDNIPGIYRVGPVKAEKLLAECTDAPEMAAVVEDAWHTYLLGDNAPDWLVHYDDGTLVTYRDYHGEEHEVHLDTIITEISDLITVGETPDGPKT